MNWQEKGEKALSTVNQGLLDTRTETKGKRRSLALTKDCLTHGQKQKGKGAF